MQSGTISDYYYTSAHWAIGLFPLLRELIFNVDLDASHFLYNWL